MKFSELKRSPDAEVQFRRGYTHGAQAVISAVEDSLTPAQLSKLRHWASGELQNWRGEGGSELREAPPTPD